MPGYLQAVRAFSPSLWRLFAALAMVICVTMGLQAVLLNLYLLRLGYDARYVGLLAGIGQTCLGGIRPTSSPHQQPDRAAQQLCD